MWVLKKKRVLVMFSKNVLGTLNPVHLKNRTGKLWEGPEEWVLCPNDQEATRSKRERCPGNVSDKVETSRGGNEGAGT